MENMTSKKAFELTPLIEKYDIWGKKITFEVWKIALLSSWSVTISDEEWNMLLTTVWIKEEDVNPNPPYFPLVVDFLDKFYATWKIWWNRFQKREWRPSEQAVLASRLIDRPIRPMFEDGFVNDTQIICTPLSANSETQIAFYWITGASLGLFMWWAPIADMVSWVRIALLDNWEMLFAPNNDEIENIKADITLAWTKYAITMIEAEGLEISDEEMIKAIEFGFEIIKSFCEAQEDFIKKYEEKYGKKELNSVFREKNVEIEEKVKKALEWENFDRLYWIWKKDFSKKLAELQDEIIEKLEIEDEDKSFADSAVYKLAKEAIRKNILDNEKRLDFRKLDEVRPIKWETWLLPRVHGSALFQRWITQALSITTLWWKEDALVIDDMFIDEEKRYMHHYNFPPYSVWEVKPMRGTWRREIGHWNLAEKALESVFPSEKDFPYIVRVVSEIVSCDGSSSMASVCGSSMSLMQAWVPIKNAVAWIAMGMIFDEETKNYKIMSDIQAQEDFLWDMDFKVAKTKNGITALQLDMKVEWLWIEVFRESFKQAGESINHILWEMEKVIKEPSSELSEYAPRILQINIDPSKISTVIWRWGENVQRMEREYEVGIHIDDDGTVNITSKSWNGWEMAIEEILWAVWEPETWAVYDWEVVKIIDWIWAIVEFRGKSWMIHISKLWKERVEKVEDKVKVWDKIKTKILKIDNVKWKIELALYVEEK